MRRLSSHLGLFAIALSLAACASAPVGRYPSGCTGVPGDQRTPAGEQETGVAATHGPGAAGVVERHQATRRPLGTTQIPPLYVYDDTGADVHAPEHVLLRTEPALITADREGYWGEVVDDRYYRVPWAGRCSQASMFAEPMDFRAPPGGLAFIEYRSPGCVECVGIEAAITRLIAAHPELPVRWVQVEVGPSIGRPAQ